MSTTSRWEWRNAGSVPALSYVCGFCSHNVGPDHGYHANRAGDAGVAHIRICSYCTLPTFFDAHGAQTPGPVPGAPIPNVPADVADLHGEVRRAMAASAWTLAVIGCRKILMNLTVTEGAAEPGLSFVEYVDALEAGGYVPVSGKATVDRIRREGNEAAHEIRSKSREEAERTFRFTEGLLRFAYEYREDEPAPDAEGGA